MLPSEFYSEYGSDRKQYETRAENIATLTLPYAIRTDGTNGATPMQDTHSQSFCGRAVNTLKAKMGMALLPPATSSFRIVPNAQTMAAISMGEGSEQDMADVNKLIAGATTIINAEIENQQVRESLFDVIIQLIIVGSCIVEKEPNDGVVVHTLKNIVVDLDRKGRPLGMCIKETMKRLPKDLVGAVDEQDEYELYTLLWKDDEKDDSWIMTQDINGVLVGKEIKYKDSTLPFKYLGWTWMTGDYTHRPFAEDMLADMESIDALSELMGDGSLIAGKNILFVNERGGRTRKDDVANSSNGAVVDGSAEDVTAFRSEKGQDMQIVAQYLNELKRELASSFLLNESATRDAERVTAEEIKFMAQELETSSLAGIYSKLAKEWSGWIIGQIQNELKLDFGTLEVNVITGLDALGRNVETQKLDGAMARAANFELTGWIKEAELINRIFAQQGVDVNNLIKTPDEKKEEDAANREAALKAQVAGSVADNAGNLIQQGQKDSSAAALQSQREEAASQQA